MLGPRKKRRKSWKGFNAVLKEFLEECRASSVVKRVRVRAVAGKTWLLLRRTMPLAYHRVQVAMV